MTPRAGNRVRRRRRFLHAAAAVGLGLIAAPALLRYASAQSWSAAIRSALALLPALRAWTALCCGRGLRRADVE